MSVETLEPEAMDPKLLTEVERQEAVLAELPEDYEFPLFDGRQAIESQRKSAYKNTARAAREIIDNAFEAGAKDVWVVFKRPTEQERAKHERRDAVSAVAFIDDGPGMMKDMARYALAWGGGTHFDDPTGIGRFGFGLPNSSINQTRRVEVYTRTGAKQPWTRAVLDINNVKQHGLVTVPPEEEVSELPAFVTEYMKKNRITLKSGTIVVWEKPDKLSARSASTLRGQMLDDFGVVYRYMLDDFRLVVDGVAVQKVDPLFLMEDARYYKSEKDGGPWCKFDKQLIVKYHKDEETGSQHLELLLSGPEVQAARQDPKAVVDVISIKVAGFPYGFAAESIRTGYDDQGEEVRKHFSKDSDENKRLQIRKKRRGMSFVRAKREIDTLDVFPTLISDKANDMGDWPVLQSYALHWGIEVRFGPKLDEVFGIGNDKQTVSPIEDFWRILAKAEVDKAVQAEEKNQRGMRKKDEEKRARKEVENPDQPNPATDAAAAADAVLGDNQPLPEERATEAKKDFEKAVDEKVKETGKPRDVVEEALQEEAQRKKYAIKFFNSEGGVFYKPGFGNGLQRVAWINTDHPFFKVFYTEISKCGSPRARQVVDLLLLALAKAELQTEGVNKLFYENHREAHWSTFLKLGLTILEDLQQGDPSEQQEEL
ncbi:MAG: ATP-binding protein [Planctomycetes bacterium]|nr:ATP-binding protein [Planctomycetota bacterium]